MIRKAGPDDAAAIAAFLEGHIETSMFLLGNLEVHGTDETTHPHGTAFFLRETGDGITGVFGATNGGYLLCQLPGLTATEAQTYAHLLKGYTFLGMTGDAAQVAVLLDALPLAGAAWSVNQSTPLYRRGLSGMTSDATIRHVADGDVDTLTAWFLADAQETGATRPGDPRKVARARAEASVGVAPVRVLVEGTAITAMAAINAQAGTAVQVGGVYVPPNLRGAGRGGAVTAALLAEAAAGGAEKAVLFAMSPEAARVYERIGFERCGDYRVAVLKTPLTLGDPR
jgi:GNAT superfamily N-acetyltransferase